MPRRKIKPRPPYAIEESYKKILLKRVGIIKALINQIFGLQTRSDSGKIIIERQDAKPDKELLAKIKKARTQFEKKYPAKNATKELVEITRRVDKHVTTQATRQIEALKPKGKTALKKAQVALIDVKKPVYQVLQKGFLKKNIDLIKSIDTRYFDQIEQLVRQSVEAGETRKALTDKIKPFLEEKHRNSEYNARRIARDQVGKLVGQINQEKQQAAGIDRYEWSTSNDERVREEHDALNGDEFSWNDPPSVGHPGEDIMCRCSAIPIL